MSNISDKYVQLKRLGVITGIGTPKTVPAQRKKTSWRDWQADAIRIIGDANFYRVNSPTGSGKSRLLSYLGTKQIAKGRRVLILVPQNNIVSAWPATYDFEKDWKPTNLSNTTLATRQELVQLINGGHDVAICCYPSFVNLIASLKKSRKLSALKDLFLIVDEAHHLSQQEDAFNGLGKALDIALPHLGGCGLSTATPFRGDRLQYLSKENTNKYFSTLYHLSMAEFFSSKDCGVNNLHYNFYLFGGSYIDALKKANKEGNHSIIYLPKNGSYLRLGSKEKDYEEVAKVFPSNLNLLSYSGNNQRHNVKKIIDDQNIKVSAVITQNLMQEGFNWNPCDSIMAIGYGSSITQTVQRIGRMLRNHDGKTDVYYNHLLPYTFNNKNEEKAKETFNEYLKVITASMIVSEILQPIYLPRTKRDVQRKPSEKNRKKFDALERLLGDVGDVASFKDAVLKNTLSNTDSSTTKKERQDVLKAYIKQELQNRKLEVSDDVRKDIFLEIYLGLARMRSLLPSGLSLKEIDVWLLSDSEDPFTVFSTTDAKTFDRMHELLKNNVTLNDCKVLAKINGGKCLSTRYVNCESHLVWECNNGHVWNASYSNVRRGTWCSKCNGKNKKDIYYVNSLAESNGGKCLSKIFNGMNSKYKFQCKYNHVWITTASSISCGTWCPDCHNNTYSLYDLKFHAEKNGGQCLSLKYENIDTKYDWQCSCGYVWSASWNRVKHQNSWCPNCAGNAKGSILNLQKAAILKGGVCLSKTYTNARNKYEFECKKGHRWLAVGHSITSGKWCKKCYYEERREK